MARYVLLFSALLLSSGVICEDCFTYNFENDFENLFSNEIGLCMGMQPWQLQNYNSNAIEPFNANSKLYISPESDLSCVASFSFSMETNGVIEVNAYMETVSPNDMIFIVVSEATSNGNDPVVASGTLSPSDANFVSGWNVLRITLAGTGVFNGYIQILGSASDGAKVLVDSFRYIPPSSDEVPCVFYENIEESTTELVTDPIIDTTIEQDDTTAEQPDTATEQPDITPEQPDTATEQPDITTEQPDTATEQPDITTEQPDTATEQPDITTEEPDTATEQPDTTTEQPDTATEQPDTVTKEPDTNNDDCISYNFELDFNTLFNDETALCDGYLSWNHDNYTSFPSVSPNENSELFISPNILPSCIASFVFTMTPQGVVEANVYMEPKSDLDHIIVLAKKVVPNGIDTVAGFFLYYPSSEQFVAGWNTLRFTVDDFKPFEGYLTFIGTAAEGSIVLVDSFRYMSPTALNDEESCSIY